MTSEERKNHIEFIEKTVKENGEHIKFTQEFIWSGDILKLPEVTLTHISYEYSGYGKGKSKIRTINEEILVIMSKAIKEGKFL